MGQDSSTISSLEVSRVWPDKTNLPDQEVEGEGIERESLVDMVRERWVSYVSLCLCPLVPAGFHYPAFSTEQDGDGCTAARAVRGEWRGGIWARFQTSALGCTGTPTSQGCNDIFFLNVAFFCSKFGFDVRIMRNRIKT